MKFLPQIAARVINKPLLLEPGYARTFFSAMASRLNINSLSDVDGEVMMGERLRASAESYTRKRVDQYGNEEVIYHVVNGVASIPVQGTLVHRFGYLNPTSGMTGYDGIVQRASMAYSDPNVTAVLLDLHTPGGEVAGCFDTSRTLRRMADATSKPLWALCCDMNCSAGMALASGAHRRLITQTGVAGSVGVVMAHASYEKQLAEEGVEVTLIHSGACKVDGNPYQALSGEVFERFQKDTTQLRQEFGQLVSEFTGMSLEAVLATEAATYRGREAIEVGFADELVNGNEAIALFSEHLSSQGRTITIGASMSKEDVNQTDQTPTDAQVQESVPTPEAAIAPAGSAATAQSERQRIGAILGHENAKGRGQLANHLALNTSMSVEDATATLAQAATQADVADMSTALDSMMETQGSVTVGADAAESAASAELDEATQAVTAWKTATGAL